MILPPPTQWNPSSTVIQSIMGDLMWESSLYRSRSWAITQGHLGSGPGVGQGPCWETCIPFKEATMLTMHPCICWCFGLTDKPTTSWNENQSYSWGKGNDSVWDKFKYMVWFIKSSFYTWISEDIYWCPNTVIKDCLNTDWVIYNT